FTVDQPGLYTFVETWEGEDGSSASHDCGEVTETVAFPDITTQVSDHVVGLGDAIYDTAIVTGVHDGQRGVVTVELYGPFDVDECAVTVVVDGEPVEGLGRDCVPVACVVDDPADLPEG